MGIQLAVVARGLGLRGAGRFEGRVLLVDRTLLSFSNWRHGVRV
jgi:hypothetical protein